jgi:hypothetical protein
MESIHDLKNCWKFIKNPTFIGQHLYSTIANMLFNLETIVFKAELVNMWHAKNEYTYAKSEIMAIFDHIPVCTVNADTVTAL